MIECQGTFNYIFSKYSLKVLESLGLTIEKEPKEEMFGYSSFNLWIYSSENLNFCIQFREIVNEENFLLNFKSAAIEAVCPGFLKDTNSSYMPSPVAHYKLKALILEDNAELKEQLNSWDFPCPILWVHSKPGDPLYTLSYKKKFPYWAVLLEHEKLEDIENLKMPDSSLISFQNKKTVWVHTETTAWDFLIQSPF
ncbi:MAG: hypothetical protein ACXVCY_08990 [Pseudobdellovibrionaceae bacterium]